MAKPIPLTHPQDPNILPVTGRVTRATSNLQKQVLLSSEDQDMEDEIVLAPLPSAHSQSQDQLLSSQRRDQTEGNGLVAVEDHVEEMEEEEEEREEREPTPEHCKDWPRDEDGNYTLPDPTPSELGLVYAEDEEEEMEEEEEEEEDSNSDISGEYGGKDPMERIQIEDEMEQLEQNVPQIVDKYKLVDRLGEGTFSSVYKAIDVQHSVFDNSEWKPEPPTGKVYVALKRIYVTSSPVRIHNELEILADLRGASNVAYLIDAIRHEDQVLAVMPYNRHQDFRTYYRRASLPMLRSYFSCLFRALAATHKLQIIHRDVKPANFLFDSMTGQGVLCDYGLAQKIGGDEFFEWRSECLHSLPGPSWGGLEGRRKSHQKMSGDVTILPGLAAGLHGTRLAKPVTLWEQTEVMEAEYDQLEDALCRREDNGEDISREDWEQLAASKPWIVPPGWVDDIQGRMAERKNFYKSWRPAKMGSSMGGNQRASYLKDDKRPSVRANRAGTRGFRAPEVLLKCPDQTVALDIWSAGIILLCFLTRRFPFFNSNDDTEALAEIAAIFGKRKMERCAALHNRTFISNIPDLETPPHANLHALVKSLNPPIIVDNSPNIYGNVPSTAEEDAEWYQDSDIYHAIDLMKRCLELDCTKRWTAEECLEHPFFSGVYDLGLGHKEERASGH